MAEKAFWRSLISAAGLTAILLLGMPAPAIAQAQNPPIKILVKLRSPLITEIEAALPTASAVPMSLTSGSTNIQTFLNRHAAQRIAPLYPQIVRLKKQTGLSDIQIAAGVGQRFARRANRLRAAFQPPEISRTYVLEIDGGQRPRLAEILTGLKADPDVEFAEEDHIISVSFIPNDPYFSSFGTWGQAYDDLWGIKKIGAPTAWDTITGTGVTVAVVDTGTDYNHPDIAANVWTNAGEIPGNGIDDDHNGYIDDVRGWDFVGPTYTSPVQSNNPIDHHGHGTHVAGTVAGVGNNATGVIGVAWHSRVMAIKGLDDQGSGPDSALAAAIIYAADNGADVISASWGSAGYSQTIADAIGYAYNLGVIIVVAAGNNSGDARNFYPASFWNVITVAASDPFDDLAGFSNRGSKIDVAAPGVDILSLRASGTSFGAAVGTSYARASGTSMATPHVSGLAALILSQNPTYSNEEVRQVLRVSATDLGTSGFDLTYGYGRINASAATTVISVLEAKIISPADGIVTQGALTISGVARGTGFASYTLEYGAGSLPTIWSTIQAGSSPGTGTLGVFDTSSLAGGLYSVRLTAYNTFGQAFTDQIQVTANPIFISSPAQPIAPTASTTFKNGTVIPVIGSAVGGNFQAFLVEWAPGLNPASGWQTTGVTLAGGGLLPVTNGLLAEWNTSSIAGAGYYTIRLTVNSNGTSRKALTMVYFEPDLLSSNWPQPLTQGPYFSSGVLPATNADGTLRLVLEAPTNGPGVGILWTLTPSGTVRQTLLPSYGSYQQPSVAELGGNAGEETIVADYSNVEVVDANDQSYALTTGALDYSRNQVMNEDVDGNSTWETLAFGNNFQNQTAHLSAWRPDGTLLSGFPIQVADQNTGSSQYNRTRFLVGDIDGDGSKDIVVQEGLSPTTFTLRRFASNGASQSWSVPILTGTPQAMAAADLDRNGKLETILVCYCGSQAILHVFQPDGSERPGWPVALPNPDQFSLSFLAVGDFDRDGHYQIVYAHQSFLYLFKDNGTLFSAAWPRQATGGGFGYTATVIGDIDGDGFPEIVTTLASAEQTTDPFFTFEFPFAVQKLVAIRKDGTIAKTWELTGANTYFPYAYPAPAIGDFNQDGITDIAVAYELYGATTQVAGIVTMLSTGGHFNAAANDWALVHQDPRNTNVKNSAGAFVSYSTTAVTGSPNPSVSGQSVTFAATVAAGVDSPATGVPTGLVAFSDGAVNLGSCALTAGACTLNTSSLTPGNHTIVGTYSGDTSFTASSSTGQSQAVNQAGSITALSSGTNPSVFGQTVTLTATVAPVAPGGGTPGGPVTLSDGGTSIGSVVLNVNGQAAFTIANLSAGTHSLTASYSGDNNFTGSTSSAVTQVVDKRATSVELTSSLNPAVPGQALNFTAVATSGAGGAPTGTMTLLDNGTSIGTGTLDASGRATMTPASLAIGTHPITARYEGDTNYGTSASTAASQIMVAAMFDPPAPQAVMAGQSVVIPLTLYAAAGSNLTLMLGCAGLPAKSSCMFSQNPVSPAAPPTGTTILLTFSTQAAAELIFNSRPRDLWPVWLLCLAMISASIAGSRGARRKLAFGACFATLILVVVIVGCAGSGANTGPSTGTGGGVIGTPKGLTTFTVTGTSEATTVNATVSVDVQ